MKRLLTLITLLLIFGAFAAAQKTKVPVCNGFDANGDRLNTQKPVLKYEDGEWHQQITQAPATNPTTPGIVIPPGGDAVPAPAPLSP